MPAVTSATELRLGANEALQLRRTIYTVPKYLKIHTPLNYGLHTAEFYQGRRLPLASRRISTYAVDPNSLDLSSLSVFVTDPIRAAAWLLVGTTFSLAVRSMVLAFLEANVGVQYRKNREKIIEEERKEKVKKLFGP